MDAGDEKRSGLHHWTSHRAVDAAVVVVTFVIGVAVMVDTYRLGAGWANGVPQSGYFPFRIGAIICIASAAIFVRALFGTSKRREPFVRWCRLRLVLAVVVPTLVYIAGIQVLGIYVASALFIAGFMRIGGKYGWARSLAVGIGTGAALFWLFEMQFQVLLPKGPLETLLGY